jgi:hypothetical protein
MSPLKMWQSSDIWEEHQQVKTADKKTLTSEQVQAMPATVRPTIVCLPVWYLKI